MKRKNRVGGGKRAGEQGKEMLSRKCSKLKVQISMAVDGGG